MNEKEFYILKEEELDLKSIFKRNTDETDFSLLERRAFNFLAREFPLEEERYTFSYNQITPCKIERMARVGYAVFYFKTYTIHILAVINAAKLLGLDFELIEVTSTFNQTIYIR